MTIGLASAVVAIATILFAANVTIINAQQLTNQPAVSQNGIRSFESAEDSFRVQVPEGWIIHNVNNTGLALSDESTQGYGILAQLCPQEQQRQQQAAIPNAGNNSSDTLSSCDQSENDIIHIVRYPDLDNRLQIRNNDNATTTSGNNNNNNIIVTNDNNILLYHMQKLEQVGYRDIEIVNSTDRLINLIDPQTNQTIQTMPAKFVEITYSTASAPNEPRSGYLISTAINATAPNVGVTKGYTVFYEGSSVSAAELALGFGSLRQLPPAVKQVFDSFELIAAPEVAQALAEQALAEQAEAAQTVEGGGDNDVGLAGGDEDDDGGDEDDDGGDEDDDGGDEDDDGGDEDDDGGDEDDDGVEGGEEVI
jgi:hypothetical protein